MRTEQGHRKWVKDRFRREGLDNFDEVHALELLLFYAIPRKDTKPIARRLLDYFGSVSKVLEATPQALRQIEGVGENTATYIKLMHEYVRYYLMSRDDAPTIFNDVNDCGNYLTKFFHGKRDESVWALCLDGKRKLLTCQKIAEGGVDAVAVSVRNVAEAALAVNAVSVILAHNHPGGLAMPSAADKAATIRIAKGLDTLGVILADHIIVADDDYISMLQSKCYDPKNVMYL